MELDEWLFHMNKTQGLNKKQMCMKLGVSKSQLYLILKKKRSPSVQFLWKLQNLSQGKIDIMELIKQYGEA